MGAQKSEQWRRNLAVLWLGTFIAGMGFSEIMPFLSLYVDDLGTFSKGELTMYSGVTYAVTFLVIALVSPIWGRLADRKGRKLMLLRSSAGMAVVIGLMGFVTNIWQLIGLRFLQGLFAGYIPNASALVAAETPRDKSGNAIGILTTGYVSGNLIGPVLGGILAQVFSIRWTFVLTGILLVIVFVLSGTMVHEHFTPVTREQQAQGGNWLRSFRNPKLIVILLISTMIIQMGNNSITPIISLYVRQLMHDVGPVTVVAGIIAALPGISTLIAAPKLGGVRRPARHRARPGVRVRLRDSDVLPARHRHQRVAAGDLSVHDRYLRRGAVPGGSDHADQGVPAGADRDRLQLEPVVSGPGQYAGVVTGRPGRQLVQL